MQKNFLRKKYKNSSNFLQNKSNDLKLIPGVYNNIKGYLYKFQVKTKFLIENEVKNEEKYQKKNSEKFSEK